MAPHTLVVALALPLCVAAAPPAEGTIESDQGRIEIMGRPVRVGERIELPEGYLVVEEKGTEDDEAGSFGVVSAQSFAMAAPEVVPGAEAGGPAGAAPLAPECAAERAAYLAEIWKQYGIQVSDPLALLEGLQGGATGPRTGFYWFAIATDMFRPLAWSSELRNRADALARCVRGR